MARRRVYMRLEFFQTRDFVILQSVFVVVLIVALVIGITGPATYFSYPMFAYNCGNTNHLGQPCQGGVALSDANSNVTFSNIQIYKPLTDFNEFLGVSFAPYASAIETFVAPVNVQVDIEVNVNNETDPVWTPYVEDLTSELDYVCYNSVPSFEGRCNEQLVAQITRTKFAWYRLTLSTLPCADCNYSWMRDVAITVYSISTDYGKFVLGFRTAFSMLAMMVFGVYLYVMADTWYVSCVSNRETPAEATFEQKWMFLLLATLILYCDPFYGLRLLSYSYMLEVIGVLFEVISDSVLLLFWLITLDKIQKDENVLSFKWFYLPKFIAVGLYALFEMISLSWLRSRYAFNPVLANDDDFNSSIFPLIVVTQIIFFLLIVWTIYLIVASWVEITNRRSLIVRFALLGFPTILLVLSDVIAMFGGVLSNSRPSSVAFTYFFVLRNVYVYALLAGYWPSPQQTRPQRGATSIEISEAEEEDGERKRLVELKPGTNPFGPAVD